MAGPTRLVPSRPVPSPCSSRTRRLPLLPLPLEGDGAAPGPRAGEAAGLRPAGEGERHKWASGGHAQLYCACGGERARPGRPGLARPPLSLRRPSRLRLVHRVGPRAPPRSVCGYCGWASPPRRPRASRALLRALLFPRSAPRGRSCAAASAAAFPGPQFELRVPSVPRGRFPAMRCFVSSLLAL